MFDLLASLAIVILAVVLYFMIYPDKIYDVNAFFNPNKSTPSSIESETSTGGEIKEGFFGSYYYPYNSTYYWPYFYTGCNENVFGDIKCLPMYINPFW